ncbi:protein max-like isoform 1-T1 [Syngnathus typhle]
MSENDDIEVDSDADKRAHHNALERKRRDHIKDSFHGLRDSVPALQGEKSSVKQASRAQILDKATEYIQYMRRKNHTHQQDIDDLKKQNALLEQQGMYCVLWRKPRATISCRATIPPTAACTPTAKGAPCRPLTAAPTPARNRSPRSLRPGRGCAWSPVRLYD